MLIYIECLPGRELGRATPSWTPWTAACPSQRVHGPMEPPECLEDAGSIRPRQTVGCQLLDAAFEKQYPLSWQQMRQEPILPRLFLSKKPRSALGERRPGPTIPTLHGKGTNENDGTRQSQNCANPPSRLPLHTYANKQRLPRGDQSHVVARSPRSTKTW